MNINHTTPTEYELKVFLDVLELCGMLTNRELDGKGMRCAEELVHRGTITKHSTASMTSYYPKENKERSHD